VGATLGRLARLSGYEICDLVAGSRRSALAAARFIGAGRPSSRTRPEIGRADLVLISTRDAAISDAVRLLAINAPALGPAVVLHTSGSLSSSALSPLTSHGIAVGSCHPLQTFEQPQRALNRVPGSYFCIEGDPRAVRAATALVRRLKGRPFSIPTDKKGLYHAAAVLASGGVASLLSVSLEMLSRCGLPEGRSRRILLPLVEATVGNVGALGARRAVTGPIPRGDTETVARNIEALRAGDPRWLELYVLLAERSIQMAEGRISDKRALLRMRKLLRGLSS
jgi:predicted short-subunit dehydrogenase-like oxidoreductase (DUF2520 family)